MDYQLELQRRSGNANSIADNTPVASIEMPPLPEQEQEEQVETSSLEEILQDSVGDEKLEQEPEIKKYPQENINVKRLREGREQAMRERDEYARQLEEMKQKEQRKQEAAPQDNEPSPDDLVEWKHVSREIKKLKEEMRGYQQQSNAVTVESRLKSQYPDFDKIVSHDNIQMLKQEYPEIAHTLTEGQDLYSKAVSAYTLIKKLGIAQGEDSFKDKQRIQTNSAKPRSSASLSPQQGDSALSRANAFANGLTPELSKRLHEEMIQAIKNRNR